MTAILTHKLCKGGAKYRCHVSNRGILIVEFSEKFRNQQKEIAEHAASSTRFSGKVMCRTV